MGETIEFDRCAVEFPAGNEFGDPERHYLTMTQVGSSNVIDNDGNIAKRWQYTAVGSETDVIVELTAAAREIENGMLKYQNGKTKTENYLKNWRKELTGTTPLSVMEFGQKFPFADLVVVHPESVVDLPDRVHDAFVTVKDEWRRTTPEGRDRPIYRADVSEANLQLFDILNEETAVRVEVNPD